MATSSEPQHPTYPDAPVQVVAEEGPPQARDLQAPARRGSATTSSVESVIGETNASTSTVATTKDQQALHVLEKGGKCNKGDKCMFRHDGPPGKPSGPTRPPSNEPPSAATPAKTVSPGHGLLLLSGDPVGADLAARTRGGRAPTKRQVRVNPKPQVRHSDVGKRQRRYSAIYADSSNCPIEAAKELEAIVEVSVANVQVHATLNAPISDSPARIVRNCINCHALPTTPDSSSWPTRAAKRI